MLNIFYISTKCKVDLSTKAAHFGLSHTLKRSSKRPLFYFIFSELALMLLIEFCSNMCISMDLSGALKEFLSLHNFGVQKCKTQIFEFFFELKNG